MSFISNTKHTFRCNLNSAGTRFPREHIITKSGLALQENTNYFHETVDIHYRIQKIP